MPDSSIDLKDDFFKRLNTKDDYSNNDNLNEFWKILREQISSDFIQKFGIQVILDKMRLGNLEQFKDGGDVSTIRNAENGVFVDLDHKKQYEKEFNRKDYEGRIIKDDNGRIIGDNRLAKQRKELFKNNKSISDAYTGKKLTKDGTTHMDHITSAKNIYNNKKARLFMSDNDRNDMAVSSSNLAPIDGRMNQSKGEYTLNEWCAKERDGQSNIERFDINTEQSNSLQKKSEKFISKTVNAHARKESFSAATERGFQQAKRKMYGVILYEISNIVLEEISSFISKWCSYSKITDKLKKARLVFLRINQRVFQRIRNIKELLEELFVSVSTGFLNGVLSTIITQIKNNFLTTIQSWNKIFQDGFSSFIQAVKIWATNPQKLAKKDLFTSVQKIIVAGISTSIGIVLGEKLRSALINILPTYLSEIISDAVAVLISGCLTALVIYSLKHFGHAIQQFSKLLNDSINSIKIGLTVTASEINLAYQTAVLKIDDSYSEVLKSIKTQYEKLNKLAELAHDMNKLASAQLSFSVSYAETSGVSDTNILHNSDEISKYFLE